MAYASWSVTFGEQPSASKWNILGTNDAAFNDGSGIANLSLSTTAISNPYKFSAKKTADVSTANGAKVSFETEDFDTNSNYDNVTNNRYTAPVTGFYFFNWEIYVSSSVGLARGILYKNGSSFKAGHGVPSSGDIITGGSALMSLSATDYVEIFYSNGSGTKTILGQTSAGYNVSFFEGFLVSRT